MSSFTAKARNRKTGEVIEVLCLDDCFGHHVYGYQIHDYTPLTEEDFNRKYEWVEQSHG